MEMDGKEGVSPGQSSPNLLSLNHSLPSFQPKFYVTRRNMGGGTTAIFPNHVRCHLHSFTYRSRPKFRKHWKPFITPLYAPLSSLSTFPISSSLLSHILPFYPIIPNLAVSHCLAVIHVITHSDYFSSFYYVILCHFMSTSYFLIFLRTSRTSLFVNFPSSS